MFAPWNATPGLIAWVTASARLCSGDYCSRPVRCRKLLLGATATMAVPRRLLAQQKAMSAIGFLGVASPPPSFMAAFHQGPGETGYVEGQNVAIEYRWAEGHYDRLPE